MTDTHKITFRVRYPGVITGWTNPGFGYVELAEAITVKAGDEVSFILDDDNEPVRVLDDALAQEKQSSQE
jgi:hypothetical protein